MGLLDWPETTPHKPPKIKIVVMTYRKLAKDVSLRSDKKCLNLPQIKTSYKPHFSDGERHLRGCREWPRLTYV